MLDTGKRGTKGRPSNFAPYATRRFAEGFDVSTNCSSSSPLRTAAILNERQLYALLAWLDTRKHADRNRLIVLLSFKSGLRAKEIASLKWSMAMNPDGNIGDHIHLTNDASKGRSGRIIALNRT